MIIDCHAHIGKSKHINSSVKDLIDSMEVAKIDKSLVFASKFADISNQELMDAISPYKDKLHGVLAYHSSDYPEKLFPYIEDANVVAVKFYLGYDHWYPTDERIYEVLKLCWKYKKTAIFHCGDCLNSMGRAKLKYSHPLNIDEVAVDNPEVKIVIAHMGNPWVRDTAEVCYKNDNVYTDISGYVYGKFSIIDVSNFEKLLKEYLRIAPPEKLLFGSDFPISDNFSYKEIVLKLIGSSIFSNAEKAFGMKV